MTDEPYCWVYILASQKRGTLYIGLTSRLAERIEEHRNGRVPGFTRQYGVRRPVHLEPFGDIHEAIARENGAEEMAPCVEDRADRGWQSGLARSLA